MTANRFGNMSNAGSDVNRDLNQSFPGAGSQSRRRRVDALGGSLCGSFWYVDGRLLIDDLLFRG